MLKVEVGQNLNENGFHHYIAYVDELPGRENPIILNLYTNLGGFVNLTSLNEEIHAQFGMENKEFMDYFYSRAGVKAIDCLSIKINGRPNFVYKNSHVYTSKAIFENITPEIIMRDSIEIKKDLSKNGEIDKDLITNFDNSLFGDTYDGENTKLNGSYCSFYLLPILFNFINLELGREALPISLANEFIDEFAYQEGNDDRENDEKQISDDWVSDLVFKPDEIKDLCGDPKKSEEFCISRLNEILGIRLSSDRYTRNGMDAKDFTNKVIIEVKYKKSDSYNTFDRKFESDIKDIISKSPYAFKTFIY